MRKWSSRQQLESQFIVLPRTPGSIRIRQLLWWSSHFRPTVAERQTAGCAVTAACGVTPLSRIASVTFGVAVEDFSVLVAEDEVEARGSVV